MVTNDRTEHELGLMPPNDNQRDSTMKTMAPDEICIALRPLVQLLARRAAHEWLAKEANNNAPHSSKPTRSAKSPKDTCPNNHG
jgi:hypothetical protein